MLGHRYEKRYTVHTFGRPSVDGTIQYGPLLAEVIYYRHGEGLARKMLWPAHPTPAAQRFGYHGRYPCPARHPTTFAFAAHAVAYADTYAAPPPARAHASHAIATTAKRSRPISVAPRRYSTRTAVPTSIKYHLRASLSRRDTRISPACA